MTNILEVPQQKLVEGLREELKKVEEIKPTLWASFVKTGMSREKPPANDDWWYERAASIMKNIYRLGPVGVDKLRTKYGSKKNRGNKPGKFFKSSGNNIRKIMQQLEKAELIKKAEKGVHKGRIIAPKGVSMMSKVASSLQKAEKKPAKAKEKPVEKEVKAE